MVEPEAEGAPLGNILIDGDRITFIANAGHGTVLTSFLALALTLVLFLLSLDGWQFYGILLLQTFLLPDLLDTFLRNFANWSRRTVFDGEAEEIRNANLLGAKKPLPFPEVADFVRVRSGSGDEAKCFYKVTRKGKRFARGWELTRPLPPESADLALMEKTVLPALGSAVAKARRREEDPTPEENPPTRHYRTDGSAYWRISRKNSPIFLFLIAVLLLVPFPTRNLSILILLIAHAVLTLFGAVRITLKPSEGTLFAGPLLWFKKEIGRRDILGLEQLRNGSIFQPYTICLRCREGGGERSVLLYCGYSGRTAEAVAGETEAVLGTMPFDNECHVFPSNASIPSPTTSAP